MTEHQHPLPKRYMLIACAVLSRECYYCAAVSRNIVDVRILEQGLHDMGEVKMSAALQAELDAVEKDKYDGVLLAYGLCSNGIRGLHAPLPLVAPKAHDCITLLMGSKTRYQKYFEENPGTFYRSVGWIENAHSHLSNPESTTAGMGMGTYHDYVEKYGEENAEYLMEMMGDWLRHYNKLAYIDTHVAHSADYSEMERATAAERGWEFEEIDGNVDLIMRMVNGQWDTEDFLVVQPGETIQPSIDINVIRTGPLNGCVSGEMSPQEPQQEST